MITLTSMLKEMSRDGRNTKTRNILKKLGISLTIRQCYILHLLATGGEVEFGMVPAKQSLRHLGLAYSTPCPHNTRGGNGKIRIRYRLTSEGELAYDTMKKKFMPVIDKINRKKAEIP